MLRSIVLGWILIYQNWSISLSGQHTIIFIQILDLSCLMFCIGGNILLNNVTNLVWGLLPWQLSELLAWGSWQHRWSTTRFIQKDWSWGLIFSQCGLEQIILVNKWFACITQLRSSIQFPWLLTEKSLETSSWHWLRLLSVYSCLIFSIKEKEKELMAGTEMRWLVFLAKNAVKLLENLSECLSRII